MAETKLTQEDLDYYRHHNVGQALVEVARDFQKQALEDFVNAGHTKLQASHQAILNNLNLNGTRLTDLALRASMSKQAVGQLLDEVERLGYIERIPDPSDGRAKIVRFTAKGRELIKSGTQIGASIQDRYAVLIGEKKMLRLRELLDELHGNIRKQESD